MPNYLTLLKWLGLVALALALIAAPVVYHNRTVEASYQRGVTVGKAEEQSKYALELVQAGEDQAQILSDESRRAADLATKLDAQRNYSKSLREQLKAQNEKNPPAVDCITSPAVTNLLRDAANGTTQAQRDAISGSLAGQMPGQPLVPEQRNIKPI